MGCSTGGARALACAALSAGRLGVVAPTVAASTVTKIFQGLHHARRRMPDISNLRNISCSSAFDSFDGTWTGICPATSCEYPARQIRAARTDGRVRCSARGSDTKR